MARMYIHLDTAPVPAKPIKTEQPTNTLTLLAKRNLPAPLSLEQAKHLFVQLNQDPTISSAQRDSLKIRSTAKLVIKMTKGMEGVDRNEVAQVLMGLKGQFKRPADYISALRKHLPPSFDKTLKMLGTSDEIASLYQSAKKI